MSILFQTNILTDIHFSHTFLRIIFVIKDKGKLMITINILKIMPPMFCIK